MNELEKRAGNPNLDKQSETAYPDSPHCLLSVIIPAKDEASSIGSLIHRVRESLCTYTYEIIVVNDNSSDITREIAESYGAVVVSHDRNLGKGAAMKTGVANVKGDIIVFLDGDGVHNPGDIPNIIAPILQDKADLVIGSRALQGWKRAGCSLTRRLCNNTASFVLFVVISLLLPLVTLFRYPLKRVKVTDCTSGFRAITKEGWRGLNLSSHGFEIETEMIYEAARTRLVITEVPINCRRNGHFSRLSVLRDGQKTLKLLAGKLISNIGREPLSWNN